MCGWLLADKPQWMPRREANWKALPTERSKVQLFARHSNNGVVVQTEASVALASLADQLIRRQRRVGGGGGVLECMCVTLCGSQSLWDRVGAACLLRLQRHSWVMLCARPHFVLTRD